MQTPKTRRERQEGLIDEALEESFPASDPISPAVGPGEPVDADENDDDDAKLALVIPAKAGIHFASCAEINMGPRLRRATSVAARSAINAFK
jgi:hypothetical protein